MAKESAVFIDRDGTLNEEVGYIREPEQVKLFDTSMEAIRRINRSGRKVIVITNQSGVARGFLDESKLAEIHKQLHTTLGDVGAHIDAIYYCPHHPRAGELPYRGECSCRKPKPGLLHQAERDFNLDLSSCFVIGDRYLDIEMAHHVGARGILVRTGYGQSEYDSNRHSWPRHPDFVADNLQEAVDWILAARGLGDV